MYMQRITSKYSESQPRKATLKTLSTSVELEGGAVEDVSAGTDIVSETSSPRGHGRSALLLSVDSTSPSSTLLGSDSALSLTRLKHTNIQ